jgi:pyruvate carboxylase
MTTATEPSLLLLYGSLRRGEPMFDQLGLAQALEFLSPAMFPGELYDLGDYPGALPGNGFVFGELYRISDPRILTSLDHYEEFDAEKPEDSLFLRRSVSIPGHGEAWVYFYNGSADGRRRIASGDWRKRRSVA